MARKPRIQYEDAFYHAYHRGNRKELIFHNDADYHRFQQFLFEAADRSGIKLFGWALMPNHFHLVVQTPRANLAQFMSRLLTRYSMYYNWRYKTVGHVFQGRYGARVCDKESYLKVLIRYVELNPYRKKKGYSLAELGRWKWTALPFYMGRKKLPVACQLAIAELLGLFGRTVGAARRSIAIFLNDGLKNGDWEAFYQPSKADILGDEGFVQYVEMQHNRKLPSLGKPIQNVAELIEKTALCFGVSPARIISPSKNRQISRIRHAMIRIATEKYRFRAKDIAASLDRTSSAVSMAILRSHNQKSSEEDLQLSSWLGGRTSKC